MSKVLELATSLTEEEILAFLDRVEQRAKAPIDVTPSKELVDAYTLPPPPDYIGMIEAVEARLESKLNSIVINAPQGNDGKNGKDGKDGKQGKDGLNGKDGNNGVDGKDGNDGVSVTSAEVTFDNHLVLYLSNGSEIDAGQINIQNSNQVIQVTQGRAEDTVTYATRYDQVSDLLAYKGEAIVGSEDDEPKWRVQKLVFGTDGDVTITWANGTTDFRNVWDDRATLTYK